MKEWGRQTNEILTYIARNGPVRYADIKRAIPGHSNISAQLSIFHKRGRIKRIQTGVYDLPILAKFPATAKQWVLFVEWDSSVNIYHYESDQLRDAVADGMIRLWEMTEYDRNSFDNQTGIRSVSVRANDEEGKSVTL